MNSIKLRDIFIFILIYLSQVYIFDSFSVFNEFNLFPFVLIILFSPKRISHDIQLIFGFFIGLSLDYIEESNYIFTMACIFTLYFKKYIYILFEGKEYINDFYFSSRYNLVKFLFFGIFIFNFVVYIFDYYRLSLIHIILYKSLINSILTFIPSIIIYRFFLYENFEKR